MDRSELFWFIFHIYLYDNNNNVTPFQEIDSILRNIRSVPLLWRCLSDPSPPLLPGGAQVDQTSYCDW